MMRRRFGLVIALSPVIGFAACDGDDAGTTARDAGLPDGAGRDASPLGDDAAPPPLLLVGSPCETDRDCLPPSVCYPSTENDFDQGRVSGGHPNGICSFDCDPSAGASPCDDTAVPSTCVVIAEVPEIRAICLPACTVGALDFEKCLGRSDMACVRPDAAAREDYCTPRCEGDYQCSGGRCDLGTGLCTSAPLRGGLPMGADCFSDVECESRICLQAGPYRFCSGLCSTGGVGCGVDPSDESLESACLYLRAIEGSFRDDAFCAELCDCDTDCLHPAARCAPFGELDPLRLAARGRAGFCAFQSDPRDVFIECVGPDGGGEDGGDAGGTLDAFAPD